MAIRIRNGVKERQQIDGSWVVADGPDDRAGQALASTGSVAGSVAGGLDTALGALDFTGDKDDSGSGLSDADLIESLKQHEESTAEVATVVVQADQGDEGEVEGSPDLPSDEGEGLTDIVSDIPGLTSDDGRGVGGSRRVRERLRARGRAGRPGRFSPKKAQNIRVAARAAEVSGPAVEDTTRSRQSRLGTRLHRRTQNGAGGNGTVKVTKTRYVASAVPALLKDRPRWVQDLFEAHFRSESTLQMRRQVTGYTADGRPKNRMKLSREDFAIGWLTAFDKFREDARLLRVRTGELLGA